MPSSGTSDICDHTHGAHLKTSRSVRTTFVFRTWIISTEIFFSGARPPVNAVAAYTLAYSKSWRPFPRFHLTPSSAIHLNFVGNGLHHQMFAQQLTGWVCGRVSKAFVFTPNTCAERDAVARRCGPSPTVQVHREQH